MTYQSNDIAKARPTHPLAPLFQAKSVVLVGASDRNSLSSICAFNLHNFGFTGRVHAVNPRGGTAHGFPCRTSCQEIGEPVDAAFIAVPQAAVMSAMEDALAAGIRNFVILSGGFGEMGAEGAVLEAELAALVRRHGARMMGPNCLGFLNYNDGVALASMRGLLPRRPGPLSMVTASGSNGNMAQLYASLYGLGFGHVVSTGNEGDIDIAEVIDFFVDDDATRAIVVYAETIRDPVRFAAAAHKALCARKPIVILKVGAGESAAAVAAAHTGALVGDDRVFNAVCRRYGLTRVYSLEQLVTSAHLMGAVGPLERPGVGVVSISGGACAIMADQTARANVSTPVFRPQTVEALKGVVSAIGATNNPLDITGAAMKDLTMWQRVIDIVSRDPQIGLTVCNTEVPIEAGSYHAEALELVTGALSSAAGPSVIVTSFPRPFNDVGREALAKAGDPVVVSGMAMGVDALADLARWSERLRQPLGETPGPERPAPAARLQDERQALAHLAGFGVRAVPAELAGSAAEAVAAAERIGGTVALKVVSPDIAHKTEVGGVALGVEGAEAVSAAYQAMRASLAERAPRARIEGVSVAPMRRDGLELLVGVTRDPQWGLVLAVGLGGVWVEALDDVSLHLLPAPVAEVEAGLRNLKAARLLAGYRGGPAADLRAIAETAVRIGEAALALGPDLQAFEVNPLWVRGSEVEALDALAIWTEASR
jgi:acyl-CoA synthetase (NDP forming)